MKRILLGVIALLLASCTATLYDPTEYQKDNPGAIVKHLDEDGDGLTDVYVVADANGAVVRNPDGSLLEVPKSRADFDRRKADDKMLSSELNAWGALGIPFAAIAAAVVARLKPNQRAKQYQDRFEETVASIEAYKSTQSPEALAELKRNVGVVSSDTRNAIRDIIAEIAKAKAGPSGSV